MLFWMALDTVELTELLGMERVMHGIVANEMHFMTLLREISGGDLSSFHAVSKN